MLISGYGMAGIECCLGCRIADGLPMDSLHE